MAIYSGFPSSLAIDYGSATNCKTIKLNSINIAIRIQYMSHHVKIAGGHAKACPPATPSCQNFLLCLSK